MIYVFLAQGFEEVEALAAVDILRRAELEVKTAGVGGKAITGSHGITVMADMEDTEVDTGNMEAVLLPGGMPGTLNLEKSQAVKASIRFCAENNKYILAICAAPSILGHMGLLKGRSAVCFPTFEQEMDGAVLSSEAVCVSGKYITAKGMGVSVDFALRIVSELCGSQKSEAIRKSIQCPVVN